MNILFVCHGNICRSPMAEALFRKLCEERGVSENFCISSSGVSSEESGNDIYPPAKAELRRHGIPFSRRGAKRITDKEFDEYDLIIALDRSNLAALRRRFGNSPKFRMLLDRDVDDPWYTDDFQSAYDDILKGCTELLDFLLQ